MEEKSAVQRALELLAQQGYTVQLGGKAVATPFSNIRAGDGTEKQPGIKAARASARRKATKKLEAKKAAHKKMVEDRAAFRLQKEKEREEYLAKQDEENDRLALLRLAEREAVKNEKMKEPVISVVDDLKRVARQSIQIITDPLILAQVGTRQAELKKAEIAASIMKFRNERHMCHCGRAILINPAYKDCPICYGEKKEKRQAEAREKCACPVLKCEGIRTVNPHDGQLWPACQQCAHKMKDGTLDPLLTKGVPHICSCCGKRISYCRDGKWTELCSGCFQGKTQESQVKKAAEELFDENTPWKPNPYTGKKGQKARQDAKARRMEALYKQGLDPSQKKQKNKKQK